MHENYHYSLMTSIYLIFLLKYIFFFFRTFRTLVPLNGYCCILFNQSEHLFMRTHELWYKPAESCVSFDHRYGYSKERFVWSLISAVGIFCLGSGATIVHGVQNLWTSQVHILKTQLETVLYFIPWNSGFLRRDSFQPPEHIEYAALVIGGSFIMEGGISNW